MDNVLFSTNFPLDVPPCLLEFAQVLKPELAKKYPIMEHFLLRPIPSSLLKAWRGGEALNKRIAQLSDSEVANLRRYLLSSDENMNPLCDLPIWPLRSKTGAIIRSTISRTNYPVLVPKDFVGWTFCSSRDVILDLREDGERSSVLKHDLAFEVSVADFLIKFLIKGTSLPDSESQTAFVIKAAKYILDNFSTLSKYDALLTELRTFFWIPSAMEDNELHRPVDLIDPRLKSQISLQPSEIPRKDFCETEEHLVFLRILGLRSSLSGELVFLCCLIR